MAAADGETVKAPCVHCGGEPRNHAILRQHDERWSNEDSQGGNAYQICKCMGCEAVRFREESWSIDDYNYNTGEMEPTVTIYPEAPRSERTPVDVAHYPDAVARIYRETIGAYNVGAMILAGAGLRAIVEAICLERQAQGKNLQDKIDALVAAGLLAKPQADLLHEERYIGNSALHEMLPPTKLDVEDGLAIVEGLLTTIYTLPGRAQRLRRKREAKTPPPSAPLGEA